MLPNYTSRRTTPVVAFLTISIIVFYMTWKRFGDLSLDGLTCGSNYRSLTSVQSFMGDSIELTIPSPLSPLSVLEPVDPICANFPNTSNILLVMKTGASESYDRIPTQLMTVLRCLPDFLVFSDKSQSIGGFHIHDSLDTVLSEAMEDNEDFATYRRQRYCAVDVQDCNSVADDPASDGWNLDKYKNIHIAEKAYDMRPHYDWYVFVDADTYVLMPNLVQWLRNLDPQEKHYLGSVSLINNLRFAHGGSGYILSQGALAEFAGNHPGIANQYDLQARHECCGDYLFAIAVKETIKLAVKQVVCQHISPFALHVFPVFALDRVRFGLANHLTK
jgi:hypothetical protein